MMAKNMAGGKIHSNTPRNDHTNTYREGEREGGGTTTSNDTVDAFYHSRSQ